MYADDTTLTYSPDITYDATHTSTIINNELEKFQNWFMANKLSLNINKTKYIIFHSSNISPLDLKLEINGIIIERVHSFRFLGLILNENLTWHDHVRSVSLKVSRAVGVLKRLKSFLLSKTLLTIYHALISCHFNNHFILWGHESDDILKLQKRAIRILSNKHYLAHTDPLF